MDRDRIRNLLIQVKEGEIEINDALHALRSLPFEDMGFAKIDHHRSIRTGYPEVIYCKGKSIEQIKEIVKSQSKHQSSILATKAGQEVYNAIRSVRDDAVFYETAGIVLIGKPLKIESGKFILIISAGTSDIPAAEEAAVTAEAFGNRVERLYDIGVAGIHRVMDNIEIIFNADVLIVAAGMDGVLPSIIGGLVDKPVIAVPTSAGYGASFDGLAALLTMLNSCAPGVAVVNIDNGFGAGYFASMLNQKDRTA